MITYIDTVDVKITQQEMSKLTQEDWDYVKPWNNPPDTAKSTLKAGSIVDGLPAGREVDRINLMWHVDPGPDPWYVDPAWRERPLEITRHGLMLPNTVDFWQQYWQQRGKTLGRAFFSRLAPGCQIYPHCDAPWGPDPAKWSGVTRYGLVIETNPEAVLTAGQHSMHVPEGTLYYFDKSETHLATNTGQTNRTHLYMDVFV